MKLSTINLALLGFIFCLTSNAFAQKKGDKSALFLNYTFEKFNSKDIEISDPGQIGLFKGLKPSTSFPADAFYGSGDFGVGNNMYGFANPIDFKNERFQGGDDKLFASDEGKNEGYAGIVTYKPGKAQKEKSFITIPFTDKSGKNVNMIKDKMYCIEFSISLAEASKYATNNIGMMFVKKVEEYQTDNVEEEGGPINAEEGRILFNYKNKVYNAYSGWDKVCNVYKARGDEKGIVIGNFYINDQTKAEVQKKIVKLEEGADAATVMPMAYYYIDNIRIKEVDSKDKCYCIKKDSTSRWVPSPTEIATEPVESEKLSPKENVEAQVIFYAQGEKKLSPAGKKCLSFLVKYLNDNPNSGVTIVAHNDRVEDSLALELEDEKDQLTDLSSQRANWIKDRLVEDFNISTSRIEIDNKHSEEPNKDLYQEEDDEDTKLARDRRVTFIIK